MNVTAIEAKFWKNFNTVDSEQTLRHCLLLETNLRLSRRHRVPTSEGTQKANCSDTSSEKCRIVVEELWRINNQPQKCRRGRKDSPEMTIEVVDGEEIEEISPRNEDSLNISALQVKVFQPSIIISKKPTTLQTNNNLVTTITREIKVEEVVAGFREAGIKAGITTNEVVVGAVGGNQMKECRKKFFFYLIFQKNISNQEKNCIFLNKKLLKLKKIFHFLEIKTLKIENLFSC